MQTKKLLVMVSLLTVVGSLLTGCAPAAAPGAESPKAGAPSPTPKAAAEQPRRGGILMTASAGDPPSLDIHQESTYMTQLPLGGAYSTIIQFDPMDDTKIIPDLAEKWDVSADGAIYTFYLRKDVKWHDGKPFTATDAKFSIDRMRDPSKGTLGPRKGWFEPVSKVETPDDYTVKVTLSRPYATLLSALATGMSPIVARHFVEEKGDLKKDALGTGPFKFKEYKRGVATELERFPDYFVKDRPYLDGVKTYVIKEPANRFAALRTGRVHLLMSHVGLSGEEVEVVKKEEPDITVTKVVMPLIEGLILNANKAPFSDTRVRRAINMAIDREAAPQFIMRGSTMSGALMPPTGQWDIPREDLLKVPGFRQPKEVDIAEAKKLLAEAGYAQGFKTAVMARAQMTEDSAIFTRDQMAKIGIDATVDIQETAASYDRLRKGEFDMAAWSIGAILDNPDLWFAELYVSKSPRNYSGVKDTKVDELYDKQSRTADLAARKKLVIEAQKAALESLPIVPLVWNARNAAHRKEVRNFKFAMTFNNDKYQDVWLAK